MGIEFVRIALCRKYQKQYCFGDDIPVSKISVNAYRIAGDVISEYAREKWLAKELKPAKDTARTMRTATPMLMYSRLLCRRARTTNAAKRPIVSAAVTK